MSAWVTGWRTPVLAAINRLKRKQDFMAVYQRGDRHNSACLSLRAYRPGHFGGEQPIRVGISISQKVSKRAVVRNRIKRQLRVACRQLIPYLDPGWDVVVVVRSAAIGCDYPEFLQQLKQLFTKAEILDGY